MDNRIDVNADVHVAGEDNIVAELVKSPGRQPPYYIVLRLGLTMSDCRIFLEIDSAETLRDQLDRVLAEVPAAPLPAEVCPACNQSIPAKKEPSNEECPF